MSSSRTEATRRVGGVRKDRLFAYSPPSFQTKHDKRVGSAAVSRRSLTAKKHFVLFKYQSIYLSGSKAV